MLNIRRMSIKQLKMLIYIDSNPRTTASGKAAGGVIKELYRQEYVLPAGKEGRSFRWEINKDNISTEDVAQMKEFVK